jgi:hypothetical protein
MNNIDTDNDVAVLPVVAVQFKYSLLSPKDADRARALAVNVRNRLERTTEDLIEIGRALAEAKTLLGHGHFGAWLQAEFGLSIRTAQNLMNVASKYENFSHLAEECGPSVLMLLASPSVPNEAIEETKAIVADGGKVSVAKVKKIVGKHKGVVAKAAPAKPAVPVAATTTAALAPDDEMVLTDGTAWEPPPADDLPTERKRASEGESYELISCLRRMGSELREHGNTLVTPTYRQMIKGHLASICEACDEIQAAQIPRRGNVEKKTINVGKVCLGIFCAELAIRQLESIKKNDPERQAGFDHVIKWIETHR